MTIMAAKLGLMVRRPKAVSNHEPHRSLILKRSKDEAISCFFCSSLFARGRLHRFSDLGRPVILRHFLGVARHFEAFLQASRSFEAPVASRDATHRSCMSAGYDAHSFCNCSREARSFDMQPG